MPLDPSLAPMFAFLAASSLILLAGAVWRRTRARINRRVRALEGEFAPFARISTRGSLWERVRLRVARSSDSSGEARLQRAQSLPMRLVMAGVYSTAAPSLYTALQIALAVPPLLAGAVLHLTFGFDFERTLLGSLIAAALGFLTPPLWLGRRIAARQLALRRSLPDFLDLMLTCIEGGLSLHAATDQVTDEFASAHPVLAVEMKRLQREVTLGGTLDTALHRLAARSGVEAIAGLAAAVQQSLQFGAGIVGALRTHADALRQEREHAAEEQAQRASIKILLPTMLFIFPVTFVVLAGPAAFELAETFSSQSPSSVATEP